MPRILKVIIIAPFIFLLFFLINKGAGYLKTIQGVSSGIDFPSANELFQSGDLNLTPSQMQSLLFNQNKNPSAFTSPEKEKEVTYQKFTTKDGKIEINYPSSWIKVNFEKIDAPVKENGLNSVFLAQNLNVNGFAQIVVSEQSLTEETTFEQILKEMEEINQAQGWDMETINMEKKEKELIVESSYDRIDGSKDHSMRSLEKMIFLNVSEEKKLYVISFVALNNIWEEFKEQAIFVIDSVKINN